MKKFRYVSNMFEGILSDASKSRRRGSSGFASEIAGGRRDIGVRTLIDDPRPLARFGCDFEMRRRERFREFTRDRSPLAF